MIISVKIDEHATDGSVARCFLTRFKDHRDIGDYVVRHVPDAVSIDVQRMIADVERVKEAGTFCDYAVLRYLFADHTVEISVPIHGYVS